MNFFDAMDVLSSGLGAQRVRMNITASNLANANTTRTPDGTPYKRKDAIFVLSEMGEEQAFGSPVEQAVRGVDVSGIEEDKNPPRMVYDPGHPDANPEGYVAMPNVNLVEEMVNMITAARAYEAGVSAMQQVADMAERSLSIGK